MDAVISTSEKQIVVQPDEFARRQDALCESEAAVSDHQIRFAKKFAVRNLRLSLCTHRVLRYAKTECIASFR